MWWLAAGARVMFGVVCLGAAAAAQAQDATWLFLPPTSNWNNDANWAPAAAPTGSATFGDSMSTNITFSTNTAVGALRFNGGAPAYAFDVEGVSLTVTGPGIIDSSSNSPTFTIGNVSSVIFRGTSTGGQARFITNAGGVFDISQIPSGGTTAGSIEGAGIYQLGSKTLTVGANNIGTVLSGVIRDGGLGGGAGGVLVKVGTGTLTLSGANTYSGGTRLNGGILAVNSDANLGTGSLSFDGGTLEALTGGGGITSNKAIALSNSGGGTFQADVGTTSTLSGAISGGGSFLDANGSLRKTGPGTLILSGVDTYTGATVVQEGTLRAGSSTGLSPNAGMTVFSVLDLNGFNSSVAFLSGNGFVTNNGTTRVNLTVGGNIAGVPDSTFFGSLSDGSSPLALTVAAGGEVRLAGANTYSGGTSIVNGGVLAVPTDNNLGTGPLLFDGGTLVLGSPFQAATFAKPVTLHPGGGTLEVTFLSTATFNGQISGTGALTEFGVGTLVLTGANTYSGGTHIILGTVEVSSDTNLGSGPLSFDSGKLEALATGGGITSSKAVTLDSGGGIFLADTGTTSTLSGAITGVGSWTKDGPGSLVLAGVNTYSGATDVLLGTLEAGSSHSLSANSAFTVTSVLDLNGFNSTIGSLSGTGIVRNNGASAAILTVGLNNTNTMFSGKLMDGPDAFGLTKIGTGTLILAGSNIYIGPTNVEAGTLEAGSSTAFSAHSAFTVTSLLDLNGFNSAIGSLSGNGTISNRGSALATLTVGTDNANTAFNGALSDGRGGLALTKIGLGTLVLTGLNTYSGGTSIDGGVLAANGDRNLGIGPLRFESGTLQALAAGGGIVSSEPITLDGGGGTFLADPGTLSTFGGTISGTGPFTKEGPGTLTLTQPNTYSGGTTINGGVLAVNSDRNLGTGPLSFDGGVLQAQAAGGGIVSTKPITLDGGGGTFLADPGTLSTFGGTISGAGPLTKVGRGTLTLTRPNTYSGGTSINGGVLAVNSDRNLGTGPLSFDGGVLQALAAGSGIVSTKPITLHGGGGTFLADPGTESSLTGAIDGPGTLIKDGLGRLVLTGVNSYYGGTVLKGGVLTVQGAHALGFGSVVVAGGTLNADPETINAGANYTQTAGGTLQLQVAGTELGQYDSLNVAGNAALGGTLELVSLGFQPKAGNHLTLLSAGEKVSGRFAQFLDPFAGAPGIDAVELLYERNSVLLLFLNFGLVSSAEGLTAMYEISFSNANIQRLTLEDRLDNLRSGSNGFSSNMKVNGASLNLGAKAEVDGKSSKDVVEPILQSGPENRWGVWVTGFGDFVSVDSDANANGYNFTTGGVSVGIDYRITGQLAIGLIGDYSHTWTALQPRGHIDVDSGRGGLYATWYSHGGYLNGAIYGGYNSYDSSRSSFGGLATGNTEGAEWSVFLSGGYDFHVGQLAVGPIASLQYTDVHVNGFSEQSSLTPLDIHSGSAESLRSDVGFRLFYPWRIGSIVLEPSLKATWEHEYKYSALPITVGFAGIPGPSETLFGPSEGHDSAVISAGVSAQLTTSVTVYVNYDGQLGRENYDSNAVTGGVRVSF